MDISMPVMDGIEAMFLIRAQMPHVQVVALSLQEALDHAREIQDAGAAVYLSKSDSPGAIIESIRRLSDDNHPRRIRNGCN